MPTEALVCPACRTWIEGSGRFVKCPVCGKRFRASDARLDTRSTSPALPPVQEGWTFDHEGQPWAETARTQSEETHGHRAEATPSTEPDEEPAAKWDVPPDGEPPANPDSEEQRAGLNLRLIFTLAFLALIFFGNRLLSGELMIVALIALFGAQWLLRRHQRGGS